MNSIQVRLQYDENEALIIQISKWKNTADSLVEEAHFSRPFRNIEVAVHADQEVAIANNVVLLIFPRIEIFGSLAFNVSDSN